MRYVELVVTLASIYAFLRLLYMIVRRIQYNRSHRPIWVVSMGDIPYFFFEFFGLPYLIVRWLLTRQKRGTDSVVHKTDKLKS